MNLCVELERKKVNIEYNVKKVIVMIHVVSAVPISTGSRLKKLMKEKGMTQKELAEICGTHEKTVSQWVNDGCKIRKANIELLAKALDVDAAYLECKQVCKSNQADKQKQQDFLAESDSREDTKRILEELGRTSAFIDYLKALGIEVDGIPSDGDEDTLEDQFIEGGKLITIGQTVKTSTEYVQSISLPDGTKFELSEAEFERIQKDAEEFILFKMNQASNKKAP